MLILRPKLILAGEAREPDHWVITDISISTRIAKGRGSPMAPCHQYGQIQSFIKTCGCALPFKKNLQNVLLNNVNLSVKPKKQKLMIYNKKRQFCILRRPFLFYRKAYLHNITVQK